MSIWGKPRKDRMKQINMRKPTMIKDKPKKITMRKDTLEHHTMKHERVKWRR